MISRSEIEAFARFKDMVTCSVLGMRKIVWAKDFRVQAIKTGSRPSE